VLVAPPVEPTDLPPVAELPPVADLPPVAELSPVAELPPVAGLPPVADLPPVAELPPVARLEPTVPPEFAPPLVVAPPLDARPPVPWPPIAVGDAEVFEEHAKSPVETATRARKRTNDLIVMTRAPRAVDTTMFCSDPQASLLAQNLPLDHIPADKWEPPWNRRKLRLVLASASPSLKQREWSDVATAR
jgi:hypothetical protein